MEVSTTDVKDGLIVNHEGTVTELQDAVGGEDGVDQLSYSCGNLGGWADGVFSLLSIFINKQSNNYKNTQQ